MKEEMTHGGRVIGRVLKDEGVECLFGIMGMTWLILEEAGRLGIKQYHFRHEQSAGFAADGYARCARKPGVCYVSNGSGLANIVSPVYHAKGCLSPIVIMMGSMGLTQEGANGAQDTHVTDILEKICKWAHVVHDWNTDAFWMRRALRDSMHYPPGPIALDFPCEAILSSGPDEQWQYTKELAPDIPKSAGDPTYVERAVQALLEAKRPVILAGDGVYWSDGAAELKELVELLQIPTCTRRTARGALPEIHPLAFTQSHRIGFSEDSDIACLIGMQVTQLDDYFETWGKGTKFIQINEAPEFIWYGLPTKVAVVGSTKLVMRQMIDCARTLLKKTPDRKEWLGQLEQCRQATSKRRKEALQNKLKSKPIHPDVLGAEIADFLDPSSTFIYDSFTGSQYITDKLVAKYAGQILDAGTHQALGHSIGMAIGAQIARPGKQVVIQIGDGGFGISGMDMETMLRYKLPVVCVLLNNDSWGGRTVPGHLFYPHHGSWKNLPDVRYDKMFADLGCHTEYVDEPEQIRPALERSFNSGLPSLLNVRCDASRTSRFMLPGYLITTWLQGNFNELPKEAQDELRSLPYLVLQQAAKDAQKVGTRVTAEELAKMTGIPIEK